MNRFNFLVLFVLLTGCVSDSQPGVDFEPAEFISTPGDSEVDIRDLSIQPDFLFDTQIDVEIKLTGAANQEAVLVQLFYDEVSDVTLFFETYNTKEPVTVRGRVPSRATAVHAVWYGESNQRLEHREWTLDAEGGDSTSK